MFQSYFWIKLIKKLNRVKQTFYNTDYLLHDWKEYLLPLIEGENNQVIALSLLPWQCNLFSYHYKKTIIKKYGKKHTAQFKYVVKSVVLSVITILRWSYAKHFVLRGYWSASEHKQ